MKSSVTPSKWQLMQVCGHQPQCRWERPWQLSCAAHGKVPWYRRPLRNSRTISGLGLWIRCRVFESRARSPFINWATYEIETAVSRGKGGVQGNDCWEDHQSPGLYRGLRTSNRPRGLDRWAEGQSQSFPQKEKGTPKVLSSATIGLHDSVCSLFQGWGIRNQFK